MSIPAFYRRAIERWVDRVGPEAAGRTLLVYGRFLTAWSGAMMIAAIVTTFVFTGPMGNPFGWLMLVFVPLMARKFAGDLRLCHRIEAELQQERHEREELARYEAEVQRAFELMCLMEPTRLRTSPSGREQRVLEEPRQWCAWCGKMGDHTSGTCRDLAEFFAMPAQHDCSREYSHDGTTAEMRDAIDYRLNARAAGGQP